jgi:hypothetical protein
VRNGLVRKTYSTLNTSPRTRHRGPSPVVWAAVADVFAIVASGLLLQSLPDAREGSDAGQARHFTAETEKIVIARTIRLNADGTLADEARKVVPFGLGDLAARLTDLPAGVVVRVEIDPQASWGNIIKLKGALEERGMRVVVD